MISDGYRVESFYDELFASDGQPRPSARPLIDRINTLPNGELERRQRTAEAALLQMGITFTVYDSDGQLYVLEDNLRCPSGISYVLENREILKHTLPLLFEDMNIRPVDDYPTWLLETLVYLASEHIDSPSVP
ncbi:MAG: circularly permuted type 2 ATP-grasp protein [Dehalococcoidia bacterium]